MKNFKEKILKIGKRKNCFIALLLVALIAFGIVTGLRGSNSANIGAIKANAFTEAPQPKNLDLNGIRYTYQTSLNELKNNYGLFKNWYYNDIFHISNNTESEINLIPKNFEDTELTTSELATTTALINQSFAFGFTDNNGVKIGKSANFKTNDNELTTNQIEFIDSDLGSGIFSFKNLTSFSVNFSLLKRIPYYNVNVDDGTLQSFTMNFVYVKDSVFLGGTGSIPTQEEIRNNSIFKAYCFSKQIDYYNFNIPRIENYELRNIFCTFEDSDEVDNCVVQSIPNQLVFSTPQLSDSETYFNIDNLKFVSNNEVNIVEYNYNFLEYGNVTKPIYKGNLLLSETKYDNEMYTYLENTIPRKQLELKFNSNVKFGGNFEFSQPRKSLYFTPVEDRINGFYIAGFGYANDNNWKNSYFYKLLNKNITYLNQNRLLYLSGFETLKMNNDNYSGSALSAQVEDILYNVQYVGDVEQNERNQRIEEDFNNLIKTVGLGAFIGLLIGILIGTPGPGLAIGAFIGLAVGIVPLLIDGLQAIFGNDFLSGLYDFFKRIAEFFVNIVDTIIEFLMNIITNPFVLILIVIIAIIYIVKRYNK